MTQAMTREIQAIVRKSVREAVNAEVMRIRASLVPLVTKSEMADIKKRYKKPTSRTARTITARF